MSIDNLTNMQFHKRPTWFNVLLLLDAFALGGLAVWRFVIDFMDNAMTGFVTTCGEIFHVQDKIAIYWVNHGAVSLLLVCITVGAYLWLRTRSRIVSAVPLSIPFILLVWFMISRG